MHASRLFKCFFFFSFFFFRATGLRNSALGKILIDQQCLSSFFNTRRSQDYEALDIHEPRVTNDSSFRVIGFFFFFFLWNVSGKIQLFCTSNLIPGFDLSMRELSRGVDVDASILFCIVIYSFNFIYSWKLLTKLWIKWFFLFRAIGRGRISLMIRFNNRV